MIEANITTMGRTIEANIDKRVVVLEGLSPYIGDNGNWYVFDSDTQTYVDTGYKAKGDKGDQGEPGPQGEPGKDYVISESDYQAIADRVPQPDLSDYVKNTDYATASKGGVVKIGTYGLNTTNDGKIMAYPTFTNAQYQNGSDQLVIGKGTLENVLNERFKEPQFELIEEITLTEDVASITRNTEPNWTPYNFKRLFLFFSYSIMPARQITVIPYINNKIVGDNFYVGVKAVDSHSTIDFSINNGLLQSANVLATFQNGNSATPRFGACKMENALISKIESVGLNGSIPSGTNIKIYGTRA